LLVLAFPCQVLAGTIQPRGHMANATVAGVSQAELEWTNPVEAPRALAVGGHHDAVPSAAEPLAALNADCPHHQSPTGFNSAIGGADSVESNDACTTCSICYLVLIPASLTAFPDPFAQHRLMAADDAFQSTALRVLERPPRRVCSV
jgi:hypothetical protein